MSESPALAPGEDVERLAAQQRQALAERPDTAIDLRHRMGLSSMSPSTFFRSLALLQGRGHARKDIKGVWHYAEPTEETRTYPLADLDATVVVRVIREEVPTRRTRIVASTQFGPSWPQGTRVAGWSVALFPSQSTPAVVEAQCQRAVERQSHEVRALRAAPPPAPPARAPRRPRAAAAQAAPPPPPAPTPPPPPPALAVEQKAVSVAPPPPPPPETEETHAVTPPVDKLPSPAQQEREDQLIKTRILGHLEGAPDGLRPDTMAAWYRRHTIPNPRGERLMAELVADGQVRREERVAGDGETVIRLHFVSRTPRPAAPPPVAPSPVAPSPDAPPPVAPAPEAARAPLVEPPANDAPAEPAAVAEEEVVEESVVVQVVRPSPILQLAVVAQELQPSLTPQSAMTVVEPLLEWSQDDVEIAERYLRAKVAELRPLVEQGKVLYPVAVACAESHARHALRAMVKAKSLPAPLASVPKAAGSGPVVAPPPAPAPPPASVSSEEAVPSSDDPAGQLPLLPEEETPAAGPTPINRMMKLLRSIEPTLDKKLALAFGHALLHYGGSDLDLIERYVREQYDMLRPLVEKRAVKYPLSFICKADAVRGGIEALRSPVGAAMPLPSAPPPAAPEPPPAAPLPEVTAAPAEVSTAALDAQMRLVLFHTPSKVMEELARNSRVRENLAADRSDIAEKKKTLEHRLHLVQEGEAEAQQQFDHLMQTLLEPLVGPGRPEPAAQKRGTASALAVAATVGMAAVAGAVVGAVAVSSGSSKKGKGRRPAVQPLPEPAPAPAPEPKRTLKRAPTLRFDKAPGYGLSEKRVRQMLEAGWTTATDIAENGCIKPSTVRTYLRSFVADGLARVEYPLEGEARYFWLGEEGT